MAIVTTKLTRREKEELKMLTEQNGTNIYRITQKLLREYMETMWEIEFNASMKNFSVEREEEIRKNEKICKRLMKEMKKARLKEYLSRKNADIKEDIEQITKKPPYYNY